MASQEKRNAVELFGTIVGNYVVKAPKTALTLLRAGYYAIGKQMKFFPDDGLLPHQQYAAVASNKSIRQSLAHPQRAATVSVFLPCELLHAMHITPLFTEGLSCYLNGARSEEAFIPYAERYGVPQTYCSYHRILLGAAFSEVLPKPRFIANTTLACDANTNTFRMLEKFWNIPHFTVDVPGSGESRESIAYVADQLRELTTFMEDVMGTSFSQERLQRILLSEKRALGHYRSSLKTLSDRFVSNDMTSEMYKVFLTHVLLGTPESERYFSLLEQDVEQAPRAKDEVRLLWVHSLPFWQPSLRKLLNGSRDYQLLCCDMNFDALTDIDETRPYETLARKLLNNTMGGPTSRRTDTILETARSLRATGIVYFCHWGCKQTLGSAVLSKELFEREGFPTLILDGDGCDRKNVNDGQMQTKLQAFLEMLETGR